ncbi:hypothetical protein ACWCYZ_27425 [Streptomyces virginiae]
MVEGEPDHRLPDPRLAALEGGEDDVRPVHAEEVRATPPIRTTRAVGRTRAVSRTGALGRARTGSPGFAVAPAHHCP